MHRAAALFEWLVDGAPGAAAAPDVAARLADGLCAAGVPLDRLGVFVTTLHPSVLGRAFRWNRGEAVKVGELTLAIRDSPTFRQSPVNVAMESRRELRLQVAAGEGLAEFAVARELAAEGFTDYLCLPLPFLNGETQAVTFATRAAAGFGAADLEVLRDVARPLARVAEILALRRTASNLLDTYVGHHSGERILAGRIFKGSIETLQAVIWFSDLRGFTELSARLPARAVIDTLNELFDCQVPAIEKCGGEVLKFMGDGLLAIFPFTSAEEAPARSAAALAAADAAFAALAVRNAAAASPIAFGLALHVGEVAYGNIGGSARLDFTAIGAAVNLAARLEGLTGKLGERLVVSADFAASADRPLVELGSFELKGVTGAERVFAPAAGRG
ncbi:MAG: adenylate/guanylate cyclase domain-containing protein [Myxococcales bacterium]|nr:adenylate/guanylate cyclase domain-containing protein [Myxococcales bacterium]